MLTRLILPLILSTCLHANEAATAPTPPPAKKPAEKPTVEKIDDKRYRVGKIEFDSSTREIRIPAKVNMAKGLLEFLIVHENGKIHEALFTTDASPSDINQCRWSGMTTKLSVRARPMISSCRRARTAWRASPKSRKQGSRWAVLAVTR